ncbi:MAG TPA: hypothetical protein VFI02_00400 [Armatimonadota bacterium]|nr:hypothetical protein [Armatimonadota bacterium]
MAITITKTEIKRKCMIPAAETSRDDDIDALIAEMQPSIEYTIADTYLNDTSNAKLQAVLKLGMLEIMSGEFLQQLYREEGASEVFSVGSLSIGSRPEHGSKLIQQGQMRLSPYLKVDEAPADESGIASTTRDTERTFTGESMKTW